MKIAVIGAGAVGTFYGAKLLKKTEVQFQSSYLFHNLKNKPIEVKSIWGNFKTKIDVFEDTNQMQPADMVLVATKSYPDINYHKLLSPVLKKESILICMQNGINQENKWNKIFKKNTILGALAFTCINRIKSNEINHIDYGKIAIAPLNDSDIKIAQYITNLFIESNIETSCTKNLRQVRWNKILWNIPFNSLSVILQNANTQEILSTPYSIYLVKLLLNEVALVANSESNVRITKKQIDDIITATLKMKPYKTSMLLDYENNRKMEVESILGEVLKIAKKNKIATPNINWAYNLLSYYNR